LYKGVHGTDLDPPADIAFHALLRVDHRRLVTHPDCPHGTPVDAAFTADALLTVDKHIYKSSLLLPAIVPFSPLKPFFRPHFFDEVEVIVQVPVNSAETIKQTTAGTLITPPATIQASALHTQPDRALRIPSALPTG
jgi:hypothetical protein